MSKNNNREETVNLFVKTITATPWGAKLLADLGADITEIDYYNRIHVALSSFERERSGSSRLQTVVPRCHLGHYEENEDRGRFFVLALEDLGQMGYTMFDFDKGMSHAETKTMLKSMAILHATSYVFANVKGVDWTEYYPTMSNLPQHIHHPSFQMLLNSSVTKYMRTGDVYRDEKLASTVDKFSSDIAKLVVGSEHKCLLHGDLWATNLMRDPDNSNCVMLDFQLVTCGDPMYEIGAAILLNTNIAELEGGRLDKLLRFYYKTFGEIVTDLDKEGSVKPYWESFLTLQDRFNTEGYLSALRFALINAHNMERFPGLKARLDHISDECFRRNLL